MQDLESTVDKADLVIPMHVFYCIQLGFKTCVVISNDRVVIIALLFCVPVFLEGLTKLWVQAEGGTSIQYVPLHTQHARLDQNLCNLLPALHSLSGCDLTSKIGTEKAAPMANPERHL